MQMKLAGSVRGSEVAEMSNRRDVLSLIIILIPLILESREELANVEKASLLGSLLKRLN